MAKQKNRLCLCIFASSVSAESGRLGSTMNTWLVVEEHPDGRSCASPRRAGRSPDRGRPTPGGSDRPRPRPSRNLLEQDTPHGKTPSPISPAMGWGEGRVLGRGSFLEPPLRDPPVPTVPWGPGTFAGPFQSQGLAKRPRQLPAASRAARKALLTGSRKEWHPCIRSPRLSLPLTTSQPHVLCPFSSFLTSHASLLFSPLWFSRPLFCPRWVSSLPLSSLLFPSHIPPSLPFTSSLFLPSSVPTSS